MEWLARQTRGGGAGGSWAARVEPGGGSLHSWKVTVALGSGRFWNHSAQTGMGRGGRTPPSGRSEAEVRTLGFMCFAKSCLFQVKNYLLTFTGS